jgi:acetyltransferase-like isoleucine patch superfamily enzyme
MSLPKQIVSSILYPPARAWNRISRPLSRAWAHARLASMIEGDLDHSVVILGAPEIHGTGRIRFGKNLFLYRELYLETQEEGTISLGDDVVISRGVHIAAFSSISVGKGSMIGEYSSIRDANHRFGDGRAVRYSGHEAIPILIGRNVWIGRSVTVLAGVTIGDGAVIGANAVVTRDVPARTIAVGIPARPIAAKATAK